MFAYRSGKDGSSGQVGQEDTISSFFFLFFPHIKYPQSCSLLAASTEVRCVKKSSIIEVKALHNPFPKDVRYSYEHAAYL